MRKGLKFTKIVKRLNFEFEKDYSLLKGLQFS